MAEHKSTPYPIGQDGVPWGDSEKAQWREMQHVKREYSRRTLTKVDALSRYWQKQQYGALSYDPQRYPLFVLKSPNWDSSKPVALITGGVHGYESSGVYGALYFLEHFAQDYEGHFNIVCAPCISPWGYETINRWNPNTVDPNRSFKWGADCEETQAIMNYLKDQELKPILHIDLHETTNTDNSEFRPALAARDGKFQDNWDIPDGFYLVGDEHRPEEDFQEAIIKKVTQVTHIAPPDKQGRIIGSPITQKGVINYDCKKAGLSTGITDAEFVTITEVYPDSPKTNPTECVEAQAAAIVGALEYVQEELEYR